MQPCATAAWMVVANFPWQSSHALSSIFPSFTPQKHFLRPLLQEPSDTHGHIIDCRPMVNAMLNFVGGKGVENVHDYGCKLTYLGIENIHQVESGSSTACLSPFLSSC